MLLIMNKIFLPLNITSIFNGKKNLLSNMQIDNEWKFEPHDMWKEYEN